MNLRVFGYDLDDLKSAIEAADIIAKENNYEDAGLGADFGQIERVAKLVIKIA